MRLKRLIVHGFKSFADRTVFRFEGSGLTAIVGPNGCGKSNVLEAIKWVLGEQRPTSLRSREMTDVIFNGTVRRAPMGLCQGTLQFDNVDRTLPIDADEVEIKRRVTRGGETDYQVNGRSVRLKDVRQLFAGTGLGAGGYGFMEQGKIDSVLASNPHDRRKVFEEAAGISRFRARRHETELKLRKVEENLTRLADIVEEITRQIRSLKIHAGKARNHRAMSARVRHLNLAFSVNRYREIAEECAALTEKVEGLETRRQDASQERDALRTAYERIEQALAEASAAVSNLRTEKAEVAGAVSSSQQKLEFQTDYAQQVVSRREKKEQELAQLAASAEELAANTEAARTELEEVLARHETVLALVSEQHEAAQGVKERAEALEAACAEVEQRLANDDRALAERSREEARAEAERNTVGQRIDESRAREDQLTAELEGARAQLGEARDDRDRVQGELQTQRAAFEAAVEAQATAKNDADHARQQLGPAREARDRATARHAALEGVLSRREALDAGPRRLLQIAERKPERAPGVRGIALEAIEISDAEQATALEAALGDAAQAVLVDTTENALSLLELVRQEKLSGVLLLPLDGLGDGDSDFELAGVTPRGEDGARVMTALLKGVTVVDPSAWEAGLGEGASQAHQGVLVATDGRMRSLHGVLSRRQMGKGSLVKVQAEAQELARQLPELEAAFEQATEALATAEATQREARENRARLEAELGQVERTAGRAEDEVLARSRVVDRLVEEGEGLLDRLRTLTGMRDDLDKRLATARSAREELNSRVEADRVGLRAERERLTEFARERDAAAAALESVRIEEAKITERRQSLEARLASFAASQRELEGREEADRRDIAELGDALSTSEETLATVRENLVSHQARAEELVAELQAAEEHAAGVRSEQEQASTRLRELEQAVESLGEDLGKLRNREGGLEASSSALIERARDELELEDLPAFATEVTERLAAEAQATADAPEAQAEAEEDAPAASEAEDAESDATETITAALDPNFIGPPEAHQVQAAEEEAEPVPAADDSLMDRLLLDENTDWKAVEKEVRKLKERIARLGNVNLAAVEELEEAEERSRLIFTERDDLDDSRARLAKILKDLEEKSTQLFVKTFDDVRLHFADIFRRLFGGGKAEMTLENPDAPLESGIEIKARPPGKEFRSITLLSGGERTMTAVALLFAIFRANPAPCAFLDEVDAALDEDNIERFCRMVKDFTDRSQFVVVTHSKRTMEASELLYGVTMPERGVSRRVAVHVEHLDEDGNFKDVDAMNRAARAEADADPSGEAPSSADDDDEQAIEDPPARHALEEPALARRAATPRKDEAGEA